MDRWLSGGITIITDEPRSGIEPHFAKLGNYCNQKRGKEKEDEQLCCQLKDYMHWPEDKKCCAR